MTMGTAKSIKTDLEKTGTSNADTISNIEKLGNLLLYTSCPISSTVSARSYRASKRCRSYGGSKSAVNDTSAKTFGFMKGQIQDSTTRL